MDERHAAVFLSWVLAFPLSLSLPLTSSLHLFGAHVHWLTCCFLFAMLSPSFDISPFCSSYQPSWP